MLQAVSFTSGLHGPMVRLIIPKTFDDLEAMSISDHNWMVSDDYWMMPDDNWMMSDDYWMVSDDYLMMSD